MHSFSCLHTKQSIICRSILKCQDVFAEWFWCWLTSQNVVGPHDHISKTSRFLKTRGAHILCNIGLQHQHIQLRTMPFFKLFNVCRLGKEIWFVKTPLGKKVFISGKKSFQGKVSIFWSQEDTHIYDNVVLRIFAIFSKTDHWHWWAQKKPRRRHFYCPGQIQLLICFTTCSKSNISYYTTSTLSK